MPVSPRETQLCRYRYDPLDRSIDWALGQQASIQRFYCKSRLVTEIQGAAKYSHLQHDNQVLAQQRHTGDKVDSVLLATDQQRSVLNALDATQPHPLAYAPYGHRPLGNGLLSLLGFNGERPDPVTGHYHLGNGYRQFNPVLMRFNSPDSWSPFGKGGLNPYAYCVGDPVNRKDPSGHTQVVAMMFDAIFENTYKNMRSQPFRKAQFSNAAKETVALFGGAEKLKILAGADKVPEAIIANSIPMPKKLTPLKELAPNEKPIDYLYKARSYLSDLVKNRNIIHELLNSKKYSKHLDADTKRLWEIEKITTKNELKRTTNYLLTLRIEGPTRSPDFIAKDWVKTASEIRDTD